jgi:hypothetical protein
VAAWGVQIVAVSLAVRHHLAAHTSIKAIRFITNYLLPPPKRAVLAHLGIPLATGETVKDEDRVPIVRKAEVDVSLMPLITLFSMLAGIVLHVRNPQCRFWSNILSGKHPSLVRCPLVITSPSGSKKRGVARGSLRLSDNLSSCNSTSLNTYIPVTSFLVHRRPFWVSHIPPPYPHLCWRLLRLDSYGSDAYNTIVAFHDAERSWNIESLLKLPEGTQPKSLLVNFLRAKL